MAAFLVRKLSVLPLLAAAFVLSSCAGTPTDANREAALKEIDATCGKICNAKHDNYAAWKYQNSRPDQYLFCIGRVEHAPPLERPSPVLLTSKEMDALQSRPDWLALTPAHMVRLESNPAFQRCLKQFSDEVAVYVKQKCIHEYQEEEARNMAGAPAITRQQLAQSFPKRVERGIASVLKLRAAINARLWETPCDRQCEETDEARVIAEKYGIFGYEEWRAFIDGFEEGKKTSGFTDIATKAKEYQDIERKAMGLHRHGIIGIDIMLITPNDVYEVDTWDLLVTGTISASEAWADIEATNKANAQANKMRASLIMRDQDLQKTIDAMEKDNARQRQREAVLLAEVEKNQKDMAEAKGDKARQEEVAKERQKILQTLRVRYQGRSEQLKNRQAMRDILGQTEQKQKLQKQYDELEANCKQLDAKIKKMEEAA